MSRPMLVLTAALLAACSGSAAQDDPAGDYLAWSVNGHALPSAIESFTSADGQACTTTLYEGHLSLNSSTFAFGLSLVTVCDGSPTPAADQTTGTYMLSGSRVTFQAQMQGPTHISTADLGSGQLRLRGVRNSGTILDLVFEEPQSSQRSGPTAAQ